MKSINVNSVKVDQVQYSARLDGAALRQVLAEAVARSAGLDLGGHNVKVAKCFIHSDNKSDAFAEVLITIDAASQE
ncbi:hypothetical protein [Variovorax sp. PBL-E5]|uniref:hypothetical protein n=1 Tax=Variovorax sp. PBL-E5 TaxID=434014 RepID=UPI00131888A0|nr:hypothetical protein [Variovorax sp. PBL-E5]VTU37084.1 hypothetical protein E5CHR_04480 [Variovorax sp. PBL-E5]